MALKEVHPPPYAFSSANTQTILKDFKRGSGLKEVPEPESTVVTGTAAIVGLSIAFALGIAAVFNARRLFR